LNFDIAIPFGVFLLHLFLKFFINKDIDKEKALDLFYELPSNFVALSLTFSLISTVNYDAAEHTGLILSFGLILVFIVILGLLRLIVDIADSKKNKWVNYLLIPFSYSIAIVFLLISMNFLNSNASEKANKIETSKSNCNVK